MTTRLTPSSWDTGATTVQGIADEFATAARALVARTTDVGAIGADQGNSTADDAVCLILPAAADVIEEVIAGLAEGLRGEGELMRGTAQDIRLTEADNAAIAEGMM